jgi:hypothetical protein
LLGGGDSTIVLIVPSFLVDCLGWSLGVVGLLAQTTTPPVTTFSLRVSTVADDQGLSVARDDWLGAQITTAQALFAPFAVGFAKTDGAPLDAPLAHVETRTDRDAFAAHTAAHFIDVFIVESLRDVDDPSRMRRGVHWHAPSGAHYVILIATAPPAVLAHELGHYFGNPHSPVADNVMSYRRTGAPVFFDADQGQRIAARARTYVRSGELLPVGD